MSPGVLLAQCRSAVGALDGGGGGSLTSSNSLYLLKSPLLSLRSLQNARTAGELSAHTDTERAEREAECLDATLSQFRLILPGVAVVPAPIGKSNG